MIVGVPVETRPDERRVALTPDSVKNLARAGFTVLVERGAGARAGYTDDDFQNKGAEICADRNALFGEARTIVQVNTYGANPGADERELDALRAGQIVVGLADPLGAADRIARMAERGVTGFGMELIPRITRAQSMDALSSMAMIAGYKAVLIAAERLPRCFPMFMTAAGTVSPARVFVVGAGVAGLQAIATAKRLGAVVSAYDVRPEVAEQVKSVGGRFVQLELDTADAGDAGGYARAADESFYERQRELMARVVAESDVVITTAAIPGRKAPILVTGDMVRSMQPGSVVVDLAAERGGNCELTCAGREIDADGVTVVGPVNVPTSVPYHASQMYGRNIATFLSHIVADGEVRLDMDDEITSGTLMCRDGEVVHARVRQSLGLEPLPC